MMDDSAGASAKKPFEDRAASDSYRPTTAPSGPMMAVSGVAIMQPMAPPPRPCLFNACCCCELCCRGKVSTKVGSIMVGVVRTLYGVLDLISWVVVSSIKLKVDQSESKSDRDFKRIIYQTRRLPVYQAVSALDVLGFAIPCGVIIIVAALRENRMLSLVYSFLSTGSAIFTIVGNTILILAVDGLQEDYFFEDGEKAFLVFNLLMWIRTIITFLVQIYCTLVGLSLYLHIKYDEDEQRAMVPYMVAAPMPSSSTVPPTTSGIYRGNNTGNEDPSTA